jgi:hypothetical protein
MKRKSEFNKGSQKPSAKTTAQNSHDALADNLIHTIEQ